VLNEIAGPPPNQTSSHIVYRIGQQGAPENVLFGFDRLNDMVIGRVPLKKGENYASRPVFAGAALPGQPMIRGADDPGFFQYKLVKFEPATQAGGPDSFTLEVLDKPIAKVERPRTDSKLPPPSVRASAEPVSR
jgi:hypothetical protein